MRMAGIAFPGAFIITLSLACFAAGAAMAESQYLVVAAEPASEAVEIGKVLNVGDTINVPAGVVVTLMGENGSVNKLTGPTAVVVTEDGGPVAASEDNRSTLSKLGELLKSDKSTADRLGASRSTRAGTAPDPWAVPLDAKTVCIRDGVLKLKRERDAGRNSQVSVEMDGMLSPGVPDWIAGETIYQYPIKLPSGAKMLRVTIDGNAVEMIVVNLPATVDPLPSIDTLSLLNRSGCTEQMLALAKSMAD